MAEKVVLDGESEEFEVIKAQWRARAGACDFERLGEFLRHLVEDYRHDYSTLPHAIGMGAYAATAAMQERGGSVTASQATAVMWSFVRAWMDWEDDNIPLKIMDYRKLLYPQMEREFKVLPSDLWDWVQEQAAGLLDAAGPDAHPAVKGHWQKILNNVAPFGMTIEGKATPD